MKLFWMNSNRNYTLFLRKHNKNLGDNSEFIPKSFIIQDQTFNWLLSLRRQRQTTDSVFVKIIIIGLFFLSSSSTSCTTHLSLFSFHIWEKKEKHELWKKFNWKEQTTWSIHHVERLRSSWRINLRERYIAIILILFTINHTYFLARQKMLQHVECTRI